MRAYYRFQPGSRRAYPRLSVITVFILATSAGSAAAQEPRSVEGRGAYATRAQLEAQVDTAERLASDPSTPAGVRGFQRGEAFRLRYRLELGDFAVGDRIVVSVLGEPTLTDTFTVRTGPRVEMGNLPPVSLEGVLRSELRSHLTAELSRYLQRPDVRAVPLLRVAVMGQVQRPGFYHVPADMLLSDVLMIAGGPGGNADLERSEIRRGDDALLSDQYFTIALTEGLSLDELNLRSGDEVMLEERRRLSLGSMFQIVTVVSTIAALIAGFGS